jgi:two-component system response regulator RegX3
VHILLVDDDPSIAASLSDALVYAGYEVTHVSTGAAALAATDYQLVLLDLGLPDMDGTEVCRQLRQQTTAPIIIVSARDGEIDRVVGLEIGADDYVVKPFSTRELVARIRAVSRRSDQTASATAAEAAEQTIGPLHIDRRTRRVTLDEEPVALTAKEFDLLAFLALDPGACLARQDILEAVWDTNWYGPTKTLDVHIASVRKKLGNSGWIEAVRGVGFRLQEPE